MPQQLNNLIFDRASADIDRVKTLTRKMIDNTATESERTEWLSGTMKGAYNAGDLNRVGGAVEYLTGMLHELGYSSIEVAPKLDWTKKDIPTQAQMARYIADIHTLRSCIPYVSKDAPEDAEKLSFQEANNIEEILNTLERVLLAMQEHFRLRQANTFFMEAGGVFNYA